MKQKKTIFKIICFILMAFLVSSCSSGRKPAHVQQGFMVGATYDVGDGNFTEFSPKRIQFMTKENSYLPEPKVAYANDVAIVSFIKVNYLGYRLDGWFLNKDASGEYSNQWDFKTMTIGSENITLYAKWTPIITYTYSIMVYDAEEDIEIVARTVEVEEGGVFNYRREPSCSGYTFLEGYFQDKECTIPWDSSFAHPGEVDGSTDVKVYAKWIKGDYKKVTNASELLINLVGNIYLMNDIDMEGRDWTLLYEYSGTIEGNGHSIKNISIDVNEFNRKDGNPDPVAATYAGVFRNLRNATIKNVTFENITFEVGARMYDVIYVSPLAGRIQGDTYIENVSITGVINIVSSSEGKRVACDVSKLGYEIEESVEIINSTTTVTVVENV